MRRNYQYQLFGLIANSDLPLPELMADEETDISFADIVIREGSIPENGLTNAASYKELFQASHAQCCWFMLPDVARYLIKNGNEIVYQPLPGVSETDLRVFLLGACMGVLLYQRGFLVLHGNAIKIKNRAIVCVGRSGAGKSTAAAAFLRRGYSILADDTSAVNAAGYVVPSFPRIKLWQDSADQLKVDTLLLSRVRPQIEKFNIPLGSNFYSLPLPVTNIYILRDSDKGELSLEHVTGIHRLRALYRNAYRNGFMECMGLQQQCLEMAGKLLSQARVTRIFRPKKNVYLDSLVDFILTDLEEMSETTI